MGRGGLAQAAAPPSPPHYILSRSPLTLPPKGLSSACRVPLAPLPLLAQGQASASADPHDEVPQLLWGLPLTGAPVEWRGPVPKVWDGLTRDGMALRCSLDGDAVAAARGPLGARVAPPINARGDGTRGDLGSASRLAARPLLPSGRSRRKMATKGFHRQPRTVKSLRGPRFKDKIWGQAPGNSRPPHASSRFRHCLLNQTAE